MRTIAVVPSAALLVVVLLGAGCAGSAPPPAPDPGTATSIGPGTPAGTASPLSPFNGTDIAWLQLTIAMHERVLPVLDLAPERIADPAVRRLAIQVRQTHRRDLERSRTLLDRTGAPKTNPHEGHDMPGMVTAGELEALATATDAEFRRLFGRHLRDHLEQAVRLAGAEQKSGTESATTALAAAIARTGGAYLSQLAEARM